MAQRPLGAAAEFTRLRFNGLTRPITNVVSVDLTGTNRIAPNNPNRIELIVVNAGTDIVTMDWNSPVVSGQGIRIAPGNTAIFHVDEDGDLVGWELFGIGSTGAQSCWVTQVVAE